MTREQLAALYEDRAAREMQYAHATKEAAEKVRCTEERLMHAEATITALTSDYLELRRKFKSCQSHELIERERALV